MRTNRFLPRLTELEDRRTPATFTVTTFDDVVDPADGKLSLREAVTAANATPAADKIVLKAGVYKLTRLGANENGNTTGDLDVTAPVTFAGLGLDKTYLDGGAIDRVVDVRGPNDGGMPVNFSKLTVRYGDVSGNGGGILATNAAIKLTDAAVTDCVASSDGGGIYVVTDEALTLVRSALRRNISENGLGGGASASFITATDSIVARNLAEIGAGGLYAGETVTLTGTVVRDNVAAEGDGGGFLALTAVLDGCTVLGNRAAEDGGGFKTFNSGTGATLTDTVVKNNRAGLNGGGLYVFAGQVSLDGCTVSGNKAGLSGGGLWTTVDTDVDRTTVSGNRARDDGGGIFCGDSLSVVGSRIVDNFSGASGGGIAALGMIMVGSTVDGNATDGFGGGLSCNGAQVVDSTISRNEAGTRGGGANLDAFQMVNVTVSNNTAGAEGGGVSFGSGNLLHCTIVENAAGEGAGGLSGVQAPTLLNTVVAQNTAFFAAFWDLNGPFSSGGGNFIGNTFATSGFGADDIVGGVVGSLDPKLGDLKSVGGKPATHTPKAGSPLIDAGVATSLSVDANGKPRVKGVAADIGAVEK